MSDFGSSSESAKARWQIHTLIDGSRGPAKTMPKWINRASNMANLQISKPTCQWNPDPRYFKRLLAYKKTCLFTDRQKCCMVANRRLAEMHIMPDTRIVLLEDTWVAQTDDYAALALAALDIWRYKNDEDCCMLGLLPKSATSIARRSKRGDLAVLGCAAVNVCAPQLHLHLSRRSFTNPKLLSKS